MASAETQRDQRYFTIFIIVYLLILASWIFFMVFHFSQYFKDDSFVLAQYLLTGRTETRLGLTGSTGWQLLATDVFVKANMLVVAMSVSTMFLIYNILPRMKHLNVWWLILGAIAAYLPTLLTIISFFQSGNTPYSGYFTLNRFLTLLVLYPLNFAVFFYLYYMIDSFILKKKD